ncbi:YfjP family GTPase [Streptomyces sp. NPDC028635]|uniref:YfjP family GTPase n=1 Tax=Streptomyces sp. NPDC028635 TaxID=3154800 RepID=UPI0033D08A4E
MTAVTDQDHTEHTDHLGDVDRADDSDHVGHVRHVDHVDHVRHVPHDDDLDQLHQPDHPDHSVEKAVDDDERRGEDGSAVTGAGPDLAGKGEGGDGPGGAFSDDAAPEGAAGALVTQGATQDAHSSDTGHEEAQPQTSSGSVGGYARVPGGRTEPDGAPGDRTRTDRAKDERPAADRATSDRAKDERPVGGRTTSDRAKGERGADDPVKAESAPDDRSQAGAPGHDDTGVWDDGLIARRVTEATAAEQTPLEPRAPGPLSVAPMAYDGPLRSRLDALRELVGLSRTRLDNRTLAEAGRVLDEASARRRLSGQHTVVALAGATGSGKSQLFNALAGVPISETGVRRPTTAAPIACSWSDGAVGLIERLGIPPRLRRRPLQNADSEQQLRGLILVDLPDHDSAAVQHREQVDRILKLVDAVIWVVDPEKYADAMLHERYLRPMAGHAEVMFVVLNQIDRLPGEATDLVLDDLRRLLDEDGIALGEFGEPGATVLALSALTGDGVGDLREALGQFVAERGAAARRIAADVDAAAVGLRPVYATRRRPGLSEEAREEFSAQLADAVGATAAGEAAERAWLRNANRACGTPWLRLWRWYHDRREPATGRLPLRSQPDEEATARQRVEHAVRTVADQASAGLPVPWAQAVREAAVRGAQGLPEALDELATRAGLPPGRPPRPGWWPVAVLAQASMTLLQIVGGLWLAGQIIGVMAPNLGVPVLLMVCGIVGGPLIEWACRMAARGPARRYGQEAERRLREAAGACGRARVLDPLAAELLRYREVREQYARVTGVGVASGR